MKSCLTLYLVAHVSEIVTDHIFGFQPALSVKSKLTNAIHASQKVNLFSFDVRSILTFKLTTLRNNNDGFSRISEYINENPSKSITVLISLNELFNSLPSLSQLASHPVVIHVDTSLSNGSLPDYGKVSALRHLGYVFLQSFGVRDAQAVTWASYLVAARQSQPVVHFFYPSDANPIAAIPASDIINGIESFLVTENVAETDEGSNETDESDIDVISVSSNERYVYKATASEIISEAFSYVSSASKGTNLSAFEYYGPKTAQSAIVLLSSAIEPFVEAIHQASFKDAYSNTGVVVIRTYRPWSSKDLLDAIPDSVCNIALVEQLHRKTTTWSPLVQDFVADLQASVDDFSTIPSFTAFQLGSVTYENIRSTLKAITTNLNSAHPINNLFIGGKVSPEPAFETSAKAEAEVKALEYAYLKVLHQIFENKLNILNSADKPDAGVANSPDYGFGAYLAFSEKRQKFISEVQAAIKDNDFESSSKAKIDDLLSSWVLSAKSFKSVQQTKNSEQTSNEIVELLRANTASASASNLLTSSDSFHLKSSWLIGSDAWAYDLGNSGVHNVISSGKNLNMLVIDSEPYSEVVASTASLRKKDIGLYAMNFGNVYVASVAVYSSYTQLLQALLEAEKFDGPSVVLAYLPYKSESDSPLAVLQETKKAVDSGYWPLYRWNPTLDEPFKLDSPRIKKNLQDFLDRENHLSLLSKRDPTFARTLEQSYGKDVRDQQKRKAKDALSRLLDGLSGPPLTILFASDGGNAENLSKRLARRAKGRGLKAAAMAMDDYPVEDLPNEENVVLITSTAGQGELPQNGRNFWEAIKSSTDIDLARVKYSVFGLGDSEYWPRKEDKHYYNKPSKDLFNRFNILGGAELIPLGQGDDQDADGYQQGYAEWEAQLWTALGVDNIAAADEPPPITNEDIKINSNYLRGTIAEGLRDDSTGAISASDQQLTKFHGIYMQDDRDIRDERKAAGLEPAYSFMVRVRLPGCVATPKQWLRMDELADERGNGTIKITTRGTFQLHGVIKKDLKPAIRGMNAALIDTVAACGDVDRNVVAAALPGNKKIHDEIIKISHEISEHLLPQTTAYHEIWLEGPDDGDKEGYTNTFENRQEGPKKKKTLVAGSTLVDHEPLYGPTYLPRKFKINIAVPPYNDVDVFAHDIGLVAIVEDNELKGFNVFIGGGMGTTHNNKKTYPRTGSLQGFVSKEKITEVCEKVMLVQRDFGDRSNRKHARLKYTVDDLGNDVYREKVEELLGYKFEEGRPFTFEQNTDQFGGWITDETGLHHFTTFVENGRVEDTAELQFKTGFRELAHMMEGTGAEFRLTANQHILISNVSDEQLPAVQAHMAKYKLDNTAFSGLRLSSAACVAFPTCGLAMAESERYLPVLITKLEEALEEYGLRHDSIVMRMTGCPNGCARPWLAEVACVGKALGAYNLMLGGGHHGERLNKLYRSSLKEDEILDTLKPMFKRWSLERHDGEHFGDFVVRVGIIAATVEGKDFWDNLPEEI